MKHIILSIATLALMGACQSQTEGGFTLVENSGGATLGHSPKSGVKILKEGSLKFKDLNKNGKLDKYEDWRLPVDDRAKDLASQMSIEQIAGLMLYSRHQSLPAATKGFSAGSYGGKAFDPSIAKASDLTDEQKKFLKEDNLRHVLITKVESPEVAAVWNNNLQAFVEGIGLGIPGNTSSDPRHSGQQGGGAEYNAGAGGQISVWPDGLAMAATFDPAIVKQFGQVAAEEYRALGITTALSPQIDLGTEPRWYRIIMTFGEDPQLSTDMAKAYVEGFQTSHGRYEISNGWGYKSVNAMAKHWPGGGAEEGGRDGHWAYGKFAVFPGNNFADHLKPFTEGAFKLDGGTKMASAIMPYYTISYNQDKKYGTNLGNGFSKYMITDLLRNEYGYDGVVCTDWLITGDEGATPDVFAGKPWGVEDQTIDERHYTVIMAGMDQFGGNNDMKPVIAAYHMGVGEHGKEFMRKRFEQSAVRLLRNIFRLGLFENPYLDPGKTQEVVGNPDFMEKGYEAQLKSVVMLKNKNSVLPVDKKKTVYVPKVHYPSVKDWWGNASAARDDYPVNMDMVKKYYTVTDNPQKADFALVFVSSPHSEGGGYSLDDRKAGGNGYIPISLQYGPYTAKSARAHSIAAGDPVIDPTITNRSYKNKSITASNTRDLNTILDTKKAMNDKPVIVVVNANKPMIFSEFEKEVDGIIVRFCIPEQAVLDIVSGATEPSGLLPLQMPANMLTVEQQLEDVPHDMKCHMDSEGNAYDFAYGLNWEGVISDIRVERYKK